MDELVAKINGYIKSAKFRTKDAVSSIQVLLA